ncbi:MAG: hypothetical protein AAFR28_06325 [Pseudomonadota bacterium]
MADDTADFYSDQLTNRLAKPPVLNNSAHAGIVYSAIAQETLTTDHDSGDMIAMLTLPSAAGLRGLYLSTDGTATTGAANIGVFRPYDDTLTTFEIIDADRFGSAVAFTTAADDTDVLRESTVVTLALKYAPLWQLAGMAADPGRELMIGLTLTADVDAGTVIDMRADYVL